MNPNRVTVLLLIALVLIFLVAWLLWGYAAGMRGQ
jgi:hypothetical protein